ncbi:cytochrome c [Vulgatibacter sp.]|uniref:cytochrome c n=1 Tax=Vulgatibacter sp. TaxID=1971226 RepID=UPI003566D73D
MRRAILPALSLLLLLGAAPQVPEKQQHDAPRMRQPAHLPAGARMLLLERMGNHRVDMTRLNFAVLFLEHETAERLARRIAAEPRLAEPVGDGGAELNSLVPPRFFELQDELKERALQLADAAARGNDGAIAKAYGSLTETCVRCHAAYLDERP